MELHSFINAFNRDGVNFWKPTRYLQYFLPHNFQIWFFPRIEFFLLGLIENFIEIFNLRLNNKKIK